MRDGCDRRVQNFQGWDLLGFSGAVECCVGLLVLREDGSLSHMCAKNPATSFAVDGSTDAPDSHTKNMEPRRMASAVTMKTHTGVGPLSSSLTFMPKKEDVRLRGTKMKAR